MCCAVDVSLMRRFTNMMQLSYPKCSMQRCCSEGMIVEVAPCREFTAEETCQHLMNCWIARHGFPTFVQSDNGIQFAANMTQEFLASAKAVQVFSNTYKPRCNGLVERQNRTLAHMLRVFCSRHMDDWDKYLPQVVGAYNSTRPRVFLLICC